MFSHGNGEPVRDAMVLSSNIFSKIVFQCYFSTAAAGVCCVSRERKKRMRANEIVPIPPIVERGDSMFSNFIYDAFNTSFENSSSSVERLSGMLRR